MSAPVPGLGAVVLCGGESSRMGRSKAWLPFGGEPLLARVVARVAHAAAPVVVVAAPEQALPRLPEGVLVVRDALSGRGPLQGLLAGLAALSTNATSPSFASAAFVASTDAPFVHPDLARRLEALRREGDHDACVPRAQGHVHPLAAVYRTSAREAVARLLDADQRRTMLLLDELDTRVVDEAELLRDPRLRASDPTLLSLRNINSPEDYRLALEQLAALSG